MCLVKLHMYLTLDLAHLGLVKLHMCSVRLHMYLTLDLGLVKVEEQDYVDFFGPVSAQKVWPDLGPEAQTKQELEWHLDYPRWVSFSQQTWLPGPCWAFECRPIMIQQPNSEGFLSRDPRTQLE